MITGQDFFISFARNCKWTMDKTIIKRYVDDFKRIFSRFIKPGVTINSIICPYKGGTVCIFQFSMAQGESVIVKDTSKTAFDVLEHEGINGIISLGPGVNKENIHFSGTNLANMGNRLVIIKDDNPDEWSITAVVNDVSKIIGKAGGNG